MARKNCCLKIYISVLSIDRFLSNPMWFSGASEVLGGALEYSYKLDECHFTFCLMGSRLSSQGAGHFATSGVNDARDLDKLVLALLKLPEVAVQCTVGLLGSSPSFGLHFLQLLHSIPGTNHCLGLWHFCVMPGKHFKAMARIPILCCSGLAANNDSQTPALQQQVKQFLPQHRSPPARYIFILTTVFCLT